MAPRAVGYVRVSSAGQLDGYGISVQQQDIRRCAKAYGFTLVGVESDEGVPGTIEASMRSTRNGIAPA